MILRLLNWERLKIQSDKERGLVQVSLIPLFFRFEK